MNYALCAFDLVDTRMDTITHSSVLRGRGVHKAHMQITRRFEQGRYGMWSFPFPLELS